jgi:hypothetical protein
LKDALLAYVARGQKKSSQSQGVVTVTDYHKILHFCVALSVEMTKAKASIDRATTQKFPTKNPESEQQLMKARPNQKMVTEDFLSKMIHTATLNSSIRVTTPPPDNLQTGTLDQLSNHYWYMNIRKSLRETVNQLPEVTIDTALQIEKNVPGETAEGGIGPAEKYYNKLRGPPAVLPFTSFPSLKAKWVNLNEPKTPDKPQAPTKSNSMIITRVVNATLNLQRQMATPLPAPASPTRAPSPSTSIHAGNESPVHAGDASQDVARFSPMQDKEGNILGSSPFLDKDGNRVDDPKDDERKMPPVDESASQELTIVQLHAKEVTGNVDDESDKIEEVAERGNDDADQLHAQEEPSNDLDESDKNEEGAESEYDNVDQIGSPVGTPEQLTAEVVIEGLNEIVGRRSSARKRTKNKDDEEHSRESKEEESNVVSKSQEKKRSKSKKSEKSDEKSKKTTGTGKFIPSSTDQYQPKKNKTPKKKSNA